VAEAMLAKRAPQCITGRKRFAIERGNLVDLRRING
jgi:hypothetical protein